MEVQYSITSALTRNTSFCLYSISAIFKHTTYFSFSQRDDMMLVSRTAAMPTQRVRTVPFRFKSPVNLERRMRWNYRKCKGLLSRFTNLQHFSTIIQRELHDSRDRNINLYLSSSHRDAATACCQCETQLPFQWLFVFRYNKEQYGIPQPHHCSLPALNFTLPENLLYVWYIATELAQAT